MPPTNTSDSESPTSDGRTHEECETEYKKAEAALTENEGRLRSLIQNMPILMYALDADGTVVSWNRECEHVTGYTEEEIIGEPRAFELLYRNPHYLQWVMDELDRRSGDYRNLETDITTKSGEKKTISWSNLSKQFPISDWSTWSVGLDISERERTKEELKESKEHLQFALETADAYKLEVDLSTGEMVPSPRLFHRLGYGPGEIPKTIKEMAELMHPEDVQGFMEAYTEHLDDRIPMIRSEYRYRAKSGVWVWFFTSGMVRQWDEEGKPSRLIGLTVDITERKEAETKLNSYAQQTETKNRELKAMTTALSMANKKLKEADQMKDEFISILAHDLGTPIAVMKGNVDILMRGTFGKLTEKQSEKLKNVLRNAHRLDKLRKDTLDLSRMAVGTMALEKEPVILNNLITEAVEDIQRLTDSKDQNISLDLPEYDALECDPGKMRQVLDNYLSNAVRYTAEGGTIVVGGLTGPDEKGGREMATVWVKDSGRGIPPDELKKVFERFYRTGERVTGSTGLGLAIVKGIVEAHGGSAWCESEGDGKGTTFFFTLPVE